MSNPIDPRRRGAGFAIAICLLLAVAPLGGCGSSDDGDGGPTNPFPTGGDIEGPTAAQLSLDLPATLALPIQAQPKTSEMPPPCVLEPWPGPGFACVTRFLVGQMALPLAAALQDAVERVVVPLNAAPIPAGFPASFSDQGVRLDLIWNEIAGGRTYQLDFFEEQSSTQLAAWSWTLNDDGSAHGRFDMNGQFLALEGQQGVPNGVSLQFDSNATGSEKHLVLEIDAGEEPSPLDMSAPTRLLLVADRSPAGWDVRYAMYHPSWLYDEQAQQGVESYVLVNATGGLTDTDPAVMRVIALPGMMTAVPPTPDQEWSICSYIWGVQAAGGQTPQFTCGDNNPFYILADGSVQEGGTVPTGFDTISTTIASVPYESAEDLTQIRDLQIGFDD